MHHLGSIETRSTHLELNLGLGDVLLATVSAGNLLCLCDLVSDSLSHRQLCIPPHRSTIVYLCAEVFQSVSLDSVDAELRIGLHRREPARQEELLAAAALLDDLDKSGLQLFD